MSICFICNLSSNDIQLNINEEEEDLQIIKCKIEYCKIYFHKKCFYYISKYCILCLLIRIFPSIKFFSIISLSKMTKETDALSFILTKKEFKEYSTVVNTDICLYSFKINTDMKINKILSFPISNSNNLSNFNSKPIPKQAIIGNWSVCINNIKLDDINKSNMNSQVKYKKLNFFVKKGENIIKCNSNNIGKKDLYYFIVVQQSSSSDQNLNGKNINNTYKSMPISISNSISNGILNFNSSEDILALAEEYKNKFELNNSISYKDILNNTNIINQYDIKIEEINIKCPFTYKTIEFPVKGRDCVHYSCFDYNTYLTVNEKNLNWICPICKRIAFKDDLIFDSLIYYLIYKYKNELDILEESGEEDQTEISNLNSLLNIKFFIDLIEKYVYLIKYFSNSQEIKEIILKYEYDIMNDKTTDFVKGNENINLNLCNNSIQLCEKNIDNSLIYDNLTIIKASDKISYIEFYILLKSFNKLPNYLDHDIKKSLFNVFQNEKYSFIRKDLNQFEFYSKKLIENFIKTSIFNEFIDIITGYFLYKIRSFYEKFLLDKKEKILFDSIAFLICDISKICKLFILNSVNLKKYLSCEFIILVTISLYKSASKIDILFPSFEDDVNNNHNSNKNQNKNILNFIKKTIFVIPGYVSTSIFFNSNTIITESLLVKYIHYLNTIILYLPDLLLHQNIINEGYLKENLNISGIFFMSIFKFFLIDNENIINGALILSSFYSNFRKEDMKEQIDKMFLLSFWEYFFKFILENIKFFGKLLLFDEDLVDNSKNLVFIYENFEDRIMKMIDKWDYNEEFIKTIKN